MFKPSSKTTSSKSTSASKASTPRSSYESSLGKPSKYDAVSTTTASKSKTKPSYKPQPLSKHLQSTLTQWS